MWSRLWTVTTAILVLAGSRAMAADLPTYEIMGFPITQHQLAAVNTAYIQQMPPVPTLMVNGMPASPVQIEVLTPRARQQLACQNSTQAQEWTGSRPDQLAVGPRPLCGEYHQDPPRTTLAP